MNNLSYKEHSISLKDRARMELTGIEDVESFTDTSVIAVSVQGNISIDGEGIKIENFSVETGKLTVSGKFDAFCYFGRKLKKKGIFSRQSDDK